MEKAVIKILEDLDKSGDEFTKKDKLKKINIGKNKWLSFQIKNKKGDW